MCADVESGVRTWQASARATIDASVMPRDREYYNIPKNDPMFSLSPEMPLQHILLF